MNENYISRVETQFSLGWIEKNPVLFVKQYHEFFSKYEREYKISAQVNDCFIWLIADKKEIGHE